MNEENKSKGYSEKKATNSTKKSRKFRNKSNKTCDSRGDNGSKSKDGYIRDNDPSWYTSYPGIYSATSNISFNQPLGVPLNLFEANDQVMGDGGKKVNIPNVMSFGVVLNPGVTTSASSMINTSMFQNYNFVRHANSGSKNYDAVDLQMYFLAVDSALAFLWQGIRAYGTLMRFSALNRAIPRVLFESYGLDYTSWTANPAQVRARLNLAATKMTSLCIPLNSRLTARHQALFQNVFTDGDTLKSQMYTFRTTVIHKWGRASKVGQLTAVSACSTSSPLTVDQYFDLLDSLLQPLLEDEDINIMSGDVLKAYGINGLTPIPTVPDMYITPILTSSDAPYMMSQIENARWVYFDKASAYDINQSVDGHIMFEPSMKIPAESILNSLHATVPFIASLLNARKQEVTNDDVMEMTRLHAVYGSNYDTDGSLIVRVRACGTEYVNDVVIHTASGSTSTVEPVYSLTRGLGGVPTPYFNFDYAPYIYIGGIVNEADKLKGFVSNVVGDVDNYTTVSKYNIELLHDTAIASELLIDQGVSSKKDA